MQRRGIWTAIACLLAVIGLAAIAVTNAQGAAPPAEAWPEQPDAEALPSGAWKNAVLYGRKLFTETYSVIGPEVADTSMRFSGNNLTCQSCHLNGGTQKFAIPMAGLYGLFPTYIAREDEVRTLEERIAGCMERSMNGRSMAFDSKEMKAMVAYIQFLSTGIPVGKALEGRATPQLPLLTRAADPVRGSKVYDEQCAFCHQANGEGQRKGPKGSDGYVYPPLWGADSFNDGAGMHRLIASASFIRANMPFGTRYDSPLLSVEDAWDVAAFINSKPRPKRAGLERDYPTRARKPVDAPFPPFADSFPLEQHILGPYQPILDARAAAAPPR